MGVVARETSTAVDWRLAVGEKTPTTSPSEAKLAPGDAVALGSSAPANVACVSGTPCVRSLGFRTGAETFEFYLSRTPIAYALFRGAECLRLAKLPLPRRALDLGCGSGEFAAWALDRPMAAGLDVSHARLRVARRRGAHAFLAQADAAALPLADESFASIVAVSVCEHLIDAPRALAEALRVLRPGGWFVATIVLIDIHKHLFYPRLFRKLRLGGLASLYLRLHDRMFNHVALHSEEEWEKMLVAAGFALVVSRKIVSPRLTRCFDFWLVTAWPYKLMQWIGVRPFVWRPKWLRRLCWKWFQAIDEECPEEGSVLLVVAEKPFRNRAGIARWLDDHLNVTLFVRLDTPIGQPWLRATTRSALSRQRQDRCAGVRQLEGVFQYRRPTRFERGVHNA